jgi:glycosyltransferase involved in cell wall biosynthesis
MSKKTKILVIADHPLSPSGVGTQTKYFIDSLVETGRYSFLCLGGAVRHQDYKPQKTDIWGEDVVIFPVDGYGNPETVRSIIRTEKPDLLWFMTDPRFYEWLWDIENEIRSLMPMVYYHVWDNYPPPHFNAKYYKSNDKVVCISKVTHDIVKAVAPNLDSCYLPHAVNSDIFKKIDEKEVLKFREIFLKEEERDFSTDRTIFFWNNRNARRKQSGTLLWWFKEFLDKVGMDQAALILHTDPRDPNGQPLDTILEHLEMDQGQIYLSTGKLPAENLAVLYNLADCTVNIADAEGFGLATLESLSCETPIIVNMTGGLQEQVTNGEEWFGVGIEPSSKAVIGSQQVPYIYEDRINKEEFISAMEKIHYMKKEERDKLGQRGREHVMSRYNFDNYQSSWVEMIDEIVERCGSWENRKGYKPWDLIEV